MKAPVFRIDAKCPVVGLPHQVRWRPTRAELTINFDQILNQSQLRLAPTQTEVQHVASFGLPRACARVPHIGSKHERSSNQDLGARVCGSLAPTFEEAGERSDFCPCPLIRAKQGPEFGDANPVAKSSW